MSFSLNDTIKKVHLETELSQSFLDYSMSVITSRALPDIRDGMKPVHRRIIYAMQDMGLWHNRPYKKSARLVGEVLGKYHPHGDSSVYDAMVRMAQDWSLRYPLVDGQGNYGSMDGDSAAAMRYTETRMAAIAHAVVRDLDKDTVDFIPNFDESLKEPSVLPTVIPTLLVNGSNGIAVGMATNIPPHNLNEAVDALIEYINKGGNITLDDVIKLMPAPDFPTGGIIYGYNGVREAYETGRGSIKIRAKYHIEEGKIKTTIVYTELPYQVNKSELVARMDNLIINSKDKNDEVAKAMRMIDEVRDESGRDGLRVVVDLKRDGIPEIVINQLFKHTALQSSFASNVIALVPDANGRLYPKTLALIEMLRHFVVHRNNVVVRRTKFNLLAAWKQAHILEGFNAALEDNNLDEFIRIIRASKNREDASLQLQNNFTTITSVNSDKLLLYLSPKQKEDISPFIPNKQAENGRFYLTKKQADAIVDMRIYRLTTDEVKKVVKDYGDILNTINELCSILDSKEKQMEIIKNELLEVKEKFGDNRRTEICYNTEELTNESYIVNEDVIITISHDGFIKRIPANTYRTQGRGGKGLKGQGTFEDDFIENVFQASTHQYLLFFTDKGKVYRVKVYDIPEGSRTAKGKSINGILTNKASDEIVTAYLPIKQFSENEYVVMCTEQGTIKKTALSEFEKVNSNGKIAVGLKDDDKLISAFISDGTCDIILGTRNGLACRFSENKIREMGRQAAGVRGISLRDNDTVVSMIIIKRQDTQVLVVSENGYGKRTKYEDFRLTNRGGKGVISMNTTEKTGKVVRLISANDQQDLIVMTTGGMIIRQAISAIRTMSRNTQGVRLINLKDNDSIADITAIAHEDLDNDDDNDITNSELNNNA